MRILVILLVLLGLAFQAQAAVTLDTANIAFSAFSNAASHSFSVTIAGSNTSLVCGVSWVDIVPSGLTATFNGDAMTSIGIAAIDSRTVELFERVNPDAGTHDFEVTPGSGNMSGVVGCFPMTGVDQSDPSGTTAADTQNSGTTLSAAVTVAAGGISLSFGYQNETGTCGAVTATGSNQTLRYEDCDPVDDENGGFGSSNTSDTGSVTHSYSLTPDNAYMVLMVVPINAAAGAPAVPSRRIINY